MDLTTSKPARHSNVRAAYEARNTNIGGDVGAGAIVINGDVHGPVSVVNAPAPTRTDMRCALQNMPPPTLQLLAAVPRNCHGHIEHAMEHISATDLLLAVRTGALSYCPSSQKLRRSSRTWLLFELSFFWAFVAVMVGLVFLSLYAIVFFKPTLIISISALACVGATYAAAHLVLIPEATALKYERLVGQLMKEQM